MKITVKEAGNWRQKLGELKERAEALQGEQQIAMGDLMTPAFVAGCSSYTSLEELFGVSPFTITSLEDFKAIPVAEWDTFISTHTRFASWEEMQRAAMKEHVRRKLGFE